MQSHKQFRIQLKGSTFSLEGWDREFSSVKELTDSLKAFVLKSGSDSFTVKKCCLPRQAGLYLLDFSILDTFCCFDCILKEAFSWHSCLISLAVISNSRESQILITVCCLEMKMLLEGIEWYELAKALSSCQCWFTHYECQNKLHNYLASFKKTVSSSR